MSDVRSDSEAYGGRDPTVKGFATIDNVSLISIEVGALSAMCGRAVQVAHCVCCGCAPPGCGKTAHAFQLEAGILDAKTQARA